MGTTTLMSLQEFERLEGPDDYELLKGELIKMSLPKRRHVVTCERIFKRLDAAFARRRAADLEVRLGQVHMEMGYLLSEDPPILLGPDVSITHPDQSGEDWYQGAPLVVFEVVSDNDRAVRLEQKVAEYLAHGSQEVWVIYPGKRHAWVYRQGTARLETHSIRSEFFPDIEIPLNDVL
jgi:Uma2 family endonuclease